MSSKMDYYMNNKKFSGDGNVDAFLGALSEQDRQAVWQSFEYGRGKDPRAATEDDTICRGCGSDTKKKQALHAFMVASRDVKSNLYTEETVSGMHTNTQREVQEWAPFAIILNEKVMAEANQRRVQPFSSSNHECMILMLSPSAGPSMNA